MADELQDNYEVVRTDELDNVIAANVRAKKFLTDLLSDPKSEKVAFDILEAALIHDNLDELKLAAAGITYGHINAIAQIIDGVKTFLEFPITPSSAPTTDYQVSNKKYVDDGLVLKASLANPVDFTGIGSNSFIDSLGVGTNTPTARLHVKGVGITNATLNLKLDDSASLEIFKIRDDGVVFSVPSYNLTTAAAANMYISATGTFSRSTSSERLKRNIEAIDSIYSKKIFEVAKKAAIFYKSKCQADNNNHTFYGLSAEKLAEIEPRLVHWGYWPEDYEIKENKIKTKQKDPKTGKIKEVESIEKEQVLKKDAKLSPVGVQYDRFVPLILVEMDRQNDEINDLKAELKAIKKHLKLK